MLVTPVNIVKIFSTAIHGKHVMPQCNCFFLCMNTQFFLTPEIVHFDPKFAISIPNFVKQATLFVKTGPSFRISKRKLEVIW